MAYVTKDYYDNQFFGESIDQDTFERYAVIASDLIDSIVMKPIDDTIDKDQLAKAASYQVELINSQGGVDAITSRAECQMSVNEKMDDYSYSESLSSEASQNQATFNGIPISPITLSILRRLGLMCRWMYSGKRRNPSGI